jgi:hypothetical protein
MDTVVVTRDDRTSQNWDILDVLNANAEGKSAQNLNLMIIWLVDE